LYYENKNPDFQNIQDLWFSWKTGSTKPEIELDKEI